MLKDLLTARREAIVQRWRDAIINTYQGATAKFLKDGKNPFGNPVGYGISLQTEALFSGLLHDSSSEKLADSIDNIVRIRAVQDFTPAQAVCFVFLLKQAIRVELADRIGDNGIASELLEFEQKIDKLALLTFDIYMNCRERLFKIRTTEIKKWSTGVVTGWQENSGRKTNRDG